jgi:hypothetical protein
MKDNCRRIDQHVPTNTRRSQDVVSNWEDPILDPAEISPVLIPEYGTIHMQRHTDGFDTNELYEAKRTATWYDILLTRFRT